MILMMIESKSMISTWNGSCFETNVFHDFDDEIITLNHILIIQFVQLCNSINDMLNHETQILMINVNRDDRVR